MSKGITIVAISEEQGEQILNKLQELVNLDTAILQRVKRIPGRAEKLDVQLGKPVNQ